MTTTSGLRDILCDSFWQGHLLLGPVCQAIKQLVCVMQAYVIATSTSVEISKVDVSKFDDAYFKSSDKAQKKKGEDAFFEEKVEKKELNADYIDNQKKVSQHLLSTASIRT